MLTLWPQRALSKVDLPEEGRPTMAAKADFIPFSSTGKDLWGRGNPVLRTGL